MLLKPIMDANPQLKPITSTTALEWLDTLGFQHKAHTKSIYYDGHEREDVVRDRMEKLAMLKATEEVTVTFGGRDCDQTCWPLLHPGEPPLVWVSQDESAFHSNEDCKSEWAEKGKGMAIKQKSRGSLLMVSAFISELHGLLRCSPAQRDAYIRDHPHSEMAAKLVAEPAWDGSSTLILEPGAAPGKDKYFDAEQLLEQTALAIEVFEATHFAPGRWVYHPSKHGKVTSATYPLAYTAVWLPPTGCKAAFFFDHSSGHGAYAKDALLASKANKGPDWKGCIAGMRDGWFYDAAGVRQPHQIQFKEGDLLPCDVLCPPGVDPAGGAPAPAAAVDTSPPTGAELEASYKLWLTGCLATLKKHNPALGTAEIQMLARTKWSDLPAERRTIYLTRVRAKATAGPQQSAGERLIRAGSAVPYMLQGRHKGLMVILSERKLYPAAGLKGACESGVKHKDSGDCCCLKMLSMQPDFMEECSALQHLCESLVTYAEMVQHRHLCIFLPKFHCELNWIERLWGAVKQYMRAHCLYTLPGLRETIRIALSQDSSDVPAHLVSSSELPVVPIHLQRRWARISRQYMKEYRKGADGSDAIQAVKLQRTTRHRDTSDARHRSTEAALAHVAMQGLSSL